ncbi:uncharacterized protein LOC125675069 isoform X2 [Ostrea edulis]|uniref:uncharacterized protein LOC125675069 isoform X2 n=1 Tax=Ostrea edulis TaxID=37623 RepID=UPI0024AF506D|nr:uncharacterized protein LOC125675069 isoform X2 [Ostrea edulis]
MHFSIPLVLTCMLIVGCGKKENKCARIAHTTAVEVPDCPRDKDQHEKRKQLKECEKWTSWCSKTTYHCVVSPHMNATIETCAPEVLIIGRKCAEINKGDRPIQRSNHQNARCMECPPNYYLSTDAYKYPECYDAVERKKSNENVAAEPGFNYWILGGIAFAVIAVIAIIVFVAIFLLRRKKQAKRKANASERRPSTREQSQAETRDNDEIFQLEEQIGSNEQNHAAVDEHHDNGNSAECDAEEISADEAKSELMPLLGKTSTAVQKRKLQFKTGRRRYVSESAADLYKSSKSELMPLLGKTSTAVQKRKLQFKTGRRRYVSESAADLYKSYKPSSTELIYSRVNNEDGRRKEGIVNKGWKRTRCKSESDAQNSVKEAGIVLQYYNIKRQTMNEIVKYSLFFIFNTLSLISREKLQQFSIVIINIEDTFRKIFIS